METTDIQPPLGKLDAECRDAEAQRDGEDSQLILLGQQIAFEVEKGGGARANLLAKGGRSREKLLDSAAVRVGVELDVVTALAMRHKRRREEEENQDEEAKKKKQAMNETLAFLKNNIGRNDLEMDMDKDGNGNGNARRLEREEEDYNESDEDEDFVVVDSDDEWADMTEDVRRATFQERYKREKARLKALHGGNGGVNGVHGNGHGLALVPEHGLDLDGDEIGINWEDG